MTSRRSLQWAIRGLAMIPIVVGTWTLIAGTRTVADRGAPTASVESEFHFFGAWWLGAGIFLFSLAPRIEQRTLELRVFALLLLLAALGRVVAILDAGWPEPPHVALMAAEFTLAPVLVLWQSSVARAAQPA
jgi:hypothetical protein